MAAGFTLSPLSWLRRITHPAHSILTSSETFILRQISSVGLKKYASVSPSAFGLGGKNRIAVVRASGAIISGGGGAMASGQISAEGVIKQLRAIGKQKVGHILLVRTRYHAHNGAQMPWRASRTWLM